MQKVLNKIIYCVLLTFVCNRSSKTWGSKLHSKLNNCPEEKILLNGTFEWKLNYKDDVDYVVSEPDLCWDDGTIVLRQCNFENGEWFPDQVHCTKFKSKNMKCPDDLIELFVNKEYVCLKISTKEQTFDEHFCYGSNYIIGYNTGSIEHEILKFLIEKFNITNFWMPVKRYEENDFNPYVIRLPGEHWNELFSYRGRLISANNLSLPDTHCMVSFIRQNNGNPNQVELQIKTTHCSAMHYSVCVIKKHFVAKWGCPQDFGSLSHRPNECYGISWDGQKYPEDFRMLQVMEYFKKINTINIIFDELDIENDKYVEVESVIPIPNGKWAIKPKYNKLKIVSYKKKMNGLCLEYIENRKNVEMTLRISPELGSLILTVYNKFYIWSNKNLENGIYCFTNADYDELSKVKLMKIWENESQTKTIFKLKIKNDDPGQYWCEAHTIFNFTHVSSPKVIAAKTTKGHAFAMQVKVNLKNYNFPFVFTPDEMKHIAVSIKKDIKNVAKNQNHLNILNIHNVRIMDIIYIHSNASYLRCICHTTVSIKSSAVDTSEEQNIDDENSVEDEEGIRYDTAVRMTARNLLIELMHEFQPNFANTVRSTEFCFPENQWLLARIGQSSTKSKLCLQKNGLPITRNCLGDFIGGAYWENMAIEDCLNFTELSLITGQLYTIGKTIILEEHVEKNIRDVRKLLESKSSELIPADVYYLATIIRNSINIIIKDRSKSVIEDVHTFDDYIALEPGKTQNLSETTLEIVRIFSLLLDVKDKIIRPSITLNSTNILLDAFEYIIDYVSALEKLSPNSTSISLETQMNDDHNKEVETVEYLDVGVVVKIAKNFLLFVINPQVANVSGIALFRANSKTSIELADETVLKGAFKNEYYRFILANQSTEELLHEQNIIMGTYVPTSLWQRLDEISMMSNSTWQEHRTQPKVVIKIYANDKFFQQTNLTTDKAVNGKIVSISIPGHDKDLPEIIPLILTISDPVDVGEFENNNETHQQNKFCSYWNYQTWATDGVAIINRSDINNDTILCGCTHLTPFAYLIGGSYNLSIESDIEIIVEKSHEQALDLITILGCSLSLFGIVGIFVTACTFRSWRKKANSKILLQLSAAIALEMILFCFVNTEENSLRLISNQIYNSCIAIGACLHYSVLVQFCWMVIIAYLQFKRYVKVFGSTRPKNFFMKATMIGWGLPLLPVACVLVFDSESYIPQEDISANSLCYPSGISFYIGIVLPVTVVIIANLVIFITVIYNIIKNPSIAIRHTEKNLALSQIRLLALLFFLLGFTWIFGLLNAMKAGLVFSYLFCLTATLQGFILFVYFVVMDPVTRRMWFKYFSKICGLKVNMENFSSVKDTTDSL